MPDELNAQTTLEMLTAIEQEEHISQRSLSSRLGVAVGLINAYVKRCLTKGWIKMSRVPPRRYAYYLTPEGFAEKSRLTAQYLASSFEFFRRARSECLASMETCRRHGWHSIVLYGISDLAEIAALAAREEGVSLVAVVSPGNKAAQFSGLPVLQALEAASPMDAVLITDILAPQQAYDHLRAAMPEARILAPALLNITRRSQP